MLMICKALVLLILELIIEYFFGTMLSKLLLKREANMGFSMLIGFMAYQAMFQVFSLAVTLTTGVLHHLTFIWSGVILLTVAISIWYGRDIVKKQVTECINIVKRYKGAVAVSILVVIAFCWYVSINGESNDDATYYIALMTTSIETDSLFKYNVYTGIDVESLYLRRALATFEIHSSVVAQITRIHPLIIARIFRACQNVILTGVAAALCGYTLLWRKEDDAIEKVLMTTNVFYVLQFPFSNTIYTPATFFLYRAYEAKAFSANLIVLTGLYLCVQILREKNYRYFLLLIVFWWGSAALSTSALVIAVVDSGLLLIPVWLQRGIAKRKQEKLHAN